MFPSNEIQQLDSYKKFQIYLNELYQYLLIDYIEFEYLPFAFQKGVFEEYFLTLDLYLDNYPVEIKEKIIYTFQQLNKI